MMDTEKIDAITRTAEALTVARVNIPRLRVSLSTHLRKGIDTAQRDDECWGRYYTYGTHPELGDSPSRVPCWALDTVMLIFVGKFGPDILASIGREHRTSFDDGWERGRVWDYHQVAERLTKAVNGGIWELHRRLDELPRLWSAIKKAGYRPPLNALPVAAKHPDKFTSVFRAITFLTDDCGWTPVQIAELLEECRL